ncbi:MAG TPA: molybdopterin cofactor-binding domain-containing protein, partial [Gaiellaceae bacterium]|nr:molybdopterin cofactor-binding domain-containing protein [Gaiellaceae bacterium]
MPDPPAHPSTTLAPSARLVGTAVRRSEDRRLLTGRGSYVDDVPVPGVLHAHFVRSDVARARITRLDTGAARAAPGVVAVFTAADLNPMRQGTMMATIMAPAAAFGIGAPEHPLADGDVRFVGDPYALVIAHSRGQAEDAGELVEADFEVRTPVVDYATAATSTELVHHEKESNIAMSSGAPVDDELQAVLDHAHHVVTETFVQQRYLPVPMEPRGIVAHWQPVIEDFRIWVSTQSPHDVRTVTSRITGVAEQQIRVTMGDVGGGFGQKAYLARDEQVIILAAHVLGRPVKWIEDRRENLVAATTARTERCTATVAADADGVLLGSHVVQLDELGAYPLSFSPGAMAATHFTGPY